jgi:hypothetical protein
MKVQLLSLEEELSRYFPDTSNKFFTSVKSPFTIAVADTPEITYERFIEMIRNTAIKSEFSFFPET